MQDFNKLPVNYIVKNEGKIVDITGQKNYIKSKVIHIVASKIDDKVIESIKKIVENKDVRQIVVNRTKLLFSPLELRRLKILENYLNSSETLNGKLKLEFLEQSTVYNFNEIKEVNDKLVKEAKIIKNGFVEMADGRKRPFSPLEKLYAIHILVSNNEYKANDMPNGDDTRNLYSILQDDRKGIVCLGYANWFKALAGLVDPKHQDFKVEVVASFSPRERKENYEYEKISDEKVYTNIYSENERHFHATNIVLVDDELYKVKGIYHNDSTFDCINPEYKKSTFLHFMWPFGGYMKANKSFIPLKILHPKLTQARNLSSLVLVDDSKLKISKSYLKYLKNPKKKIYLKQKEKTYRILSSQIDKAKKLHLSMGKEFMLRKDSKEKIFEEHKYNSWESAIKQYIKDNTGIYIDNKNFISYYNHGGVFPDFDSLNDEQISDLKITIMGENYRNAKKEIVTNYKTEGVDQSKALKDFISYNNKKRELKTIKIINDKDIRQILPEIQELYKIDADEVLRLITFQPDFIQKYILPSYIKNSSLDDFRANIDNIISNCELRYDDVSRAMAEKERKDFKKLEENENETEIIINSMMRIKDNVYNYLKTISEEKLKESNFDLTRLEDEGVNKE